MDAVGISNFRKNLKDYVQKVNDDSTPLIVTNRNPEDNVVVMSKRDYDSMQETMAVLSNMYLMNKIHRGDEQFAAGKGQIHELIEDQEDPRHD
ncbi:type II toxin-antitoxin system Phd/YefM family antitoxin [Lactobacillus sp. CC-MHH1034]|uniref:type II toxin-antitoxin system Phd/YefM family antitoxin n=1 Tax=Agrilactobacillus fermenti TaxID=2586909 RepID=UPI001E2F1D43|nr:type II toxin-antitoxin system Phd/YefM family antitoxin [Agrilactobacillus fermenti]MCD2257296.1 type II toxin-antitoxin system Phd/YefM family antitoxin [Agrilactobacillus fermenti]